MYVHIYTCVSTLVVCTCNTSTHIDICVHAEREPEVDEVLVKADGPPTEPGSRVPADSTVPTERFK